MVGATIREDSYDVLKEKLERFSKFRKSSYDPGSGGSGRSNHFWGRLLPCFEGNARKVERVATMKSYDVLKEKLESKIYH